MRQEESLASDTEAQKEAQKVSEKPYLGGAQLESSD